jgi:hypothetical protein
MSKKNKGNNKGNQNPMNTNNQNMPQQPDACDTKQNVKKSGAQNSGKPSDKC